MFILFNYFIIKGTQLRGVAEKNPEQAFMVYGCNDKEIKQYRENNPIKIYFLWGISHQISAWSNGNDGYSIDAVSKICIGWFKWGRYCTLDVSNEDV
jgi:hypothetical protein